MTASPIHVNTHLLPLELIEAMDRHYWPRELDADRLRHIFGSFVEWPRLFSLETIVEVNRAWPMESREVYLGAADTQFPPGDIDPKRSVLIGEFGPDQLLALDYRSDPPAVLWLTPVKDAPWRRIAASVGEFIGTIEL